MLRTDQELPVKTGKELRVSIINLRAQSPLTWSIQKLTDEELVNG
ncbi:MAG: hypothetical protein ABSF44_16470 [Candidatus Bathyarchaeia archaeon]